MAAAAAAAAAAADIPDEASPAETEDSNIGQRFNYYFIVENEKFKI